MFRATKSHRDMNMTGRPAPGLFYSKTDRQKLNTVVANYSILAANYSILAANYFILAANYSILAAKTSTKKEVSATPM